MRQCQSASNASNLPLEVSSLTDYASDETSWVVTTFSAVVRESVTVRTRIVGRIGSGGIRTFPVDISPEHVPLDIAPPGQFSLPFYMV